MLKATKVTTIVCILILLSNPVVMANPIVKSLIDLDSWTNTIQVYSNDKVDVYVPLDMLNMNLFWTNYPRNGNFTFSFYVYFKDEEVRQKAIYSYKESIQKGIANIYGFTTPDALSCVVEQSFFDIENNKLTTTGEFYIDYDGNSMGGRREFKETINLDDKHQLFSKIAINCAAILEYYKSQPKNAIYIVELQRQRQ